MIAEAIVARKLEITGHEILKSIHPHPTMSEAVMEAVADAYGKVIHLYVRGTRSEVRDKKYVKTDLEFSNRFF